MLAETPLTLTSSMTTIFGYKDDVVPPNGWTRRSYRPPASTLSRAPRLLDTGLDTIVYELVIFHPFNIQNKGSQRHA